MTNFLNVDIPYFFGYVDEAFFKDEYPNIKNKRIPMEFFAFTSITNRCGLFTGVSEWGTQHARIPIHYIFTKPDGCMDVPLDFLQLWDSYSYYCSVNCFNYLKNKNVEVILKDKKIMTGKYMFTIDWCNGGYSENASGHKTGHVVECDGRILIQPNNRIVRWCDGGAFTTGRLKGRPDWKVFSKEFSCEQSAGRWVSESEEELYWYEFKQI